MLISKPFDLQTTYGWQRWLACGACACVCIRNLLLTVCHAHLLFFMNVFTNELFYFILHYCFKLQLVTLSKCIKLLIDMWCSSNKNNKDIFKTLMCRLFITISLVQVFYASRVLYPCDILCYHLRSLNCSPEHLLYITHDYTQGQNVAENWELFYSCEFFINPGIWEECWDRKFHPSSRNLFLQTRFYKRPRKFSGEKLLICSCPWCWTP